MDPANIIAGVAALGAILVPITALILNYRGFASIERRMEILEADLKEFYKVQSAPATDIALIKNKMNI